VGKAYLAVLNVGKAYPAVPSVWASFRRRHWIRRVVMPAAEDLRAEVAPASGLRRDDPEAGGPVRPA